MHFCDSLTSYSVLTLPIHSDMMRSYLNNVGSSGHLYDKKNSQLISVEEKERRFNFDSHTEKYLIAWSLLSIYLPTNALHQRSNPVFSQFPRCLHAYREESKDTFAPQKQNDAWAISHYNIISMLRVGEIILGGEVEDEIKPRAKGRT